MQEQPICQRCNQYLRTLILRNAPAWLPNLFALTAIATTSPRTNLARNGTFNSCSAPVQRLTTYSLTMLFLTLCGQILPHTISDLSRSASTRIILPLFLPSPCPTTQARLSRPNLSQASLRSPPPHKRLSPGPTRDTSSSLSRNPAALYPPLPPTPPLITTLSRPIIAAF